jgi:beclin 1
MSIMGLGGSSAAPDDKNKDGEEQWTRACRAVLAVLKRILMVESEADRSIASHATA